MILKAGAILAGAMGSRTVAWVPSSFGRRDLLFLHPVRAYCEETAYIAIECSTRMRRNFKFYFAAHKRCEALQ
jgi:hypothetical protein